MFWCIGMDFVISELCFKGTILQKNIGKINGPLEKSMVKILGAIT